MGHNGAPAFVRGVSGYSQGKPTLRVAMTGGLAEDATLSARWRDESQTRRFKGGFCPESISGFVGTVDLYFPCRTSL